ncbi:MAG TPA: hypothetical protein VN641_09175 [Urbifossiella sp.]|nr:hypothetical protein [Urbifossiella sp.]
MAVNVDVLCTRLEHAITLLERVGEDHWAAWLREDLARIRGGNIEGLSHLRSAFGGMGSFNDLVIHTVNGHRIVPDESDSVNKELDLLRSSIFEVVQSVRQQAEAELDAADVTSIS